MYRTQYFIGRTVFLMPNQQCLSTEGNNRTMQGGIEKSKHCIFTQYTMYITYKQKANISKIPIHLYH